MNAAVQRMREKLFPKFREIVNAGRSVKVTSEVHVGSGVRTPTIVRAFFFVLLLSAGLRHQGCAWAAHRPRAPTRPRSRRRWRRQTPSEATPLAAASLWRVIAAWDVGLRTDWGGHQRKMHHFKLSVSALRRLPAQGKTEEQIACAFARTCRVAYSWLQLGACCCWEPNPHLGSRRGCERCRPLSRTCCCIAAATTHTTTKPRPQRAERRPPVPRPRG